MVAAGDVARWTHPGLGETLRVEHWTNAAEGGAASARNLLAGSAAAQPYDPVPFFWSDQYQTKIQMIGLPGGDDEVVVVDGSVEEGRLVALYRRGDRLRGRPGLQPPPPADGLPPAAGRRGLVRRGAGRVAVVRPSPRAPAPGRLSVVAGEVEGGADLLGRGFHAPVGVALHQLG